MGFALASALGCSGAEVGRPPAVAATNPLAEVLSAVNARCPGFEAPKSVRGPREDLFVETAILDLPSTWAAQASLQTLSNLSRNDQVHLVATPHVIGKFGQQTEMELGANGEMHEQASLVRWRMLPHRADGAVVLDLELELAPPTSEHVTVTSPRVLRFSMTAHENEPVLARVEWDAASRRSLLLVVRPFEIRDEQDLRAIFQCKMQQHALAVSRARAKSR